MSDILQEAESLIEKHTTSGYIHRDATLLLPGLVEEIKRLQNESESENDYAHSEWERLAALVPRIVNERDRWQQIAIDRTAQIGWHTSCNCGRLPNDLKWPYCDWAQEIPQSVRDGWNEWAAKELGLQVKQEAGYVDRLERLALSLCMEAGWDQEDFEAALEKIRRGQI